MNQIIAKALLSLLVFALACGCSPKTVVRSLQPTASNAALAGTDAVEVLETESSFEIEAAPLVEIEVRDNGLSIRCGYEEVVALAKEQARLAGCNCLFITEHRPPDAISTCHRIKALGYKLDDLEHYKRYIDWAPGRLLRIEDFRGPTEERPFQAATVSGFSYQSMAMPYQRNFNIDVRVYFDKKLSYFKRDSTEVFVLKHEQVHFDISELHARKFMARIDAEIDDAQEWMETHKRIYREVYDEMVLAQDKYDSEVHADPSKQDLWSEWVKTELDKYAQYGLVRSIEKPQRVYSTGPGQVNK